MSLIARMSFDDEDPPLHVHLTERANELHQEQPVEWVRVLRTLEESLAEYGRRVRAHRESVESMLTMQGATQVRNGHHPEDAA